MKLLKPSPTPWQQIRRRERIGEVIVWVVIIIGLTLWIIEIWR